MKRLVAVALLALVAPSCSGPHSKLDVGVKEIDTDVLIGPQRARPPIALPPGTPSGPVGFPGFIQPPIDTGPQPSPAPPPVCPAADPLSPVAHELTTTASKPPVAASYPFRNDGTWKFGGIRGVFPSLANRNIKNIQDPAPSGGFSFDVTIPDLAGSATTTTYHAYPSQPTPADPSPGLYVEKRVTESPHAPTLTFTPTPSLLLLPFPAAIGSAWSSRGVDPLTQAVEEFDGKILAKETFNACGTKVQAWKVQIANGSITSPTTDLAFSAILWIAPQYGGLLLKDKVIEDGTVKQSPTDQTATALDSSNTASITVAPRYRP